MYVYSLHKCKNYIFGISTVLIRVLQRNRTNMGYICIHLKTLIIRHWLNRMMEARSPMIVPPQIRDPGEPTVYTPICGQKNIDVSSQEVRQRERILPFSAFFSIQGFNGLAEVYPLWGGQSDLISPSIHMLISSISSGNTFTYTTRYNV